MIGPSNQRARTHQRRKYPIITCTSDDKYPVNGDIIDELLITSRDKLRLDGETFVDSKTCLTGANEVDQWRQTGVYRASGCCQKNIRRERRIDRTESHLFLLFATAAVFIALALSPVMGATSDSIDDETSSATSLTTASTTSPPVLPGKTRVFGDLGGSIDLLAALQLHNRTRQGVTQVPGLARLKPAYYLQGEERDLQLSQTSFERAASLLRRVPEFTVAAALRQEEANSGTIVAFSHGNNRYLELQSSGRKDELRLHYVSRRDGAVHVESFPFRLADGAWHRVALSISGSQVELLVDCHPLYRRLLRPGPPDTNFTLPQLQLWVGQRNAKHFLFKGALQDVKLIPGAHGYLSQCPQLDTSCPTCGQFSILQNTVEQLMHNLNELTRRLAAAEGRISKVEECECQKSCRENGTVHDDGATWEKNCQLCSCVHGEIECRPIPCAPVTCKYPLIPEGQCCPICLKQCYTHGVIFDHGEKMSPRQCLECECIDGVSECSRTKTKCPPLPCSPSEQITVADECCKFCPAVCNGTCQNGGECIAPGRCSCRRGYIGNSCELDLDECASDLHRCHHSSTCFNMPGWYYCRCKPGYRSALHDSSQGTQCLDIDECNDQTLERRHTCHPTARCINTDGGYQCDCPGVETSQECKLSCWFEDREVGNGETLAPAGNPCRQCTCKDGVISCRDPICDCSLPSSRRDKCCPQCDPAASCRHQELHHLIFRSGERWIYQCQTCECLYGEIDCWQMECPPVSCTNPVTEDGDCCPRCEDDPCAREIHTNITGIALSSHPRPCSYAGIIHDSGSSWQDPHDKCTTCECKVPYCAQLDGQLCCSYDYGCAGDLGNGTPSIPPRKSDTTSVLRSTDPSSAHIATSKTTVSTIGPNDNNPRLSPRDIRASDKSPESTIIIETTKTQTISSPKTFKSSEKYNDQSSGVDDAHGITKNIISFPKAQPVNRKLLATTRSQQRRAQLVIGKRSDVDAGRSGYIAARAIGSTDAT
ncbi:protein kinase C-binding protein NELL1-like isoform X5 [Diachasmimorpha longicaudata]|uniref:protein kinase C-binding protein NELL1-like isoform X5 n=1 Tax=Diachasmimorpha longicaudata TaxID=58733 RepID=UPI0030B892EC